MAVKWKDKWDSSGNFEGGGGGGEMVNERGERCGR